jgi:HD-GYP domain-containing protein (c-di-GMP phosphodiesterase class II)
MVEAKLKSLPVDLLQVGDVIDADLYDGRLLLLPSGTVISGRFLKLLRERDISSVSTASKLLERRMALKSGRQADDDLLAELAAAEVELRQAAGIVEALTEEMVFSAQKSVSTFFQCLLENAEPKLGEVQEHAKGLLNQILATQNKERVVLNLYDMKTYDPYTYAHSVNVAGIYTLMNAERLATANDAEELVLGALLHDAGKISVPVHILTKPGRLTPEEFEVIKTHTTSGCDILQNRLQLSPTIFGVARWHHERYDGTGYPDGLSHDQIPDDALALAVCDVFDALVTERPYKAKMETPAAVRVLAQSSGTHFAPLMVNRFLSVLGMYPNGSYVEISDGRLGLVIAQTSGLLRPRVRIIGSAKSGIQDQGVELDLSKEPSLSVKRHLKMIR